MTLINFFPKKKLLNLYDHQATRYCFHCIEYPFDDQFKILFYEWQPTLRTTFSVKILSTLTLLIFSIYKLMSRLTYMPC